MRKQRWGIGLAMLALALGCPGDDSGTTGASSGTASGTGIDPTVTPTTASVDSSTGVGTGNGTTAGPVDSSTGPGATEGTSSGGSSGDPTGGGSGTYDCPNSMQTLECDDGIDNDGDGAIDLFDPECIGPCDDDEGSFQTGLPGDNMDCNQDCFFDGNSGHGDDGCEWSLTCDPANPGAGLMPVSCDYNPGPQCDGMMAEPSPECIEACAPLTPPGCDCFGCCEVQTPEGPIHIFLNSEPPCSLENLEACNLCTLQIETCGTPCVPEKCQVCFGEDSPPKGCGGVECPGGGAACEGNEDCPALYFCYLNCCYPPPEP